MLAGSVDALASSLDAINDFHLAEIVPIAKLYQVLGLSKYFSPNSPGGSKMMPANTQNGELIRSVSAFITGFYLLDLVGFSYIKPLSTFGQFSRGAAAFGIVNATVTPTMETRVADLLSKDAGLKSVILDYLSVHPDDSHAEARFKNGLEGLALGAVFEPCLIVFRIIKNTFTRTLITRVPTRRTYKLEAEPIKPAESTQQAGIASDIAKMDDIIEKAEIDAIKETNRVLAQAGTVVYSPNVSQQKQMRHILGTAPANKSYLHSLDDAQKVLDAYNSGNYRLISENTKQSTVVIEVKGITGRYINTGNPNGLSDVNEPTNIFMIQSSGSPKIVPVNPNKGGQ